MLLLPREESWSLPTSPDAERAGAGAAPSLGRLRREAADIVGGRGGRTERSAATISGGQGAGGGMDSRRMRNAVEGVWRASCATPSSRTP